MRGQRGQVAAEYMGVLLVVSVIIAALATTDLGRELGRQAETLVCRIGEGPCEQAKKKSSGRSERASGRSQRSRSARPLARAAAALDPRGGKDSDGDGISDKRERARGSDPGSPDTDRDGLHDASDPAPRDTDFDNDGLLDGEDPVPGHQDYDRDGLTDGQEIALGTNARSRDTDGDGRLDRVEFDAGSDPTKRVLPLTEDNALKPWERVGMTQRQWFDFSKEVLEEVNPKGWRAWLEGERYYGVNLDENGQLKLLEHAYMGVGVSPRAILQVLGAASKLPSVAAVATKVAGKMPIAVAGALMARSVIPAVARIKTPAPPPAGITYGATDKLGRATGAAATITKHMLNTGTRAATRIKPPGFVDGSHHRGHLIGKLLGGTGQDARNLTAMFNNANTPVMRGFEKQIAKAVRGGQVVRYQVTPIYRGNDLVARGLTMKATGSGKNPLNLHVTVLNIPKH